tara:strand:+ start:7544 stop:8176 length:633 start_codon:yes stop_codon:yes gene_type:complete
MDISDYILKLEADLQKEAQVNDEENSTQSNYIKSLNPKLKAKKTKKNKDQLKGNEAEDEDLVDFDSDNEDDEDDEELDADIDLEIDLKKASSYSEFVNIVNHFRAGASFKKNEEIEKYWDRLSRGEKMTLFSLISALTQVSAGGLSGGSAKLPSELGIKISKDATEKEKKISKRNKNIKPVKPSKDDAPIIVGESQDTSLIRKYLKNING